MKNNEYIKIQTYLDNLQDHLHRNDIYIDDTFDTVLRLLDENPLNVDTDVIVNHLKEYHRNEIDASIAEASKIFGEKNDPERHDYIVKSSIAAISFDSYQENYTTQTIGF